MITRKKFREIVFLLLFSQDFFLFEDDSYIYFFMQMLQTTKKNIKKAYEDVKKVLSKKKEIDKLIKQTSKNYSFDRISKVELNILRLSLYEMLFDELIPYKVAISEAVRLSRKFGSKDSAKFVNAIIDNIYKSYDKK